MRRRAAMIAIGIVAVAAVGAVLFATRHGLDVSPDSATYLSTANNIDRGRGFTTPFPLFPPGNPVAALPRVGGTPRPTAMTLFAPLYPAVLAAAHTGLGLSLLTDARILNAVALAAVALAASWSVAASKPRARWPAVLVAVVVIGPPDLLALSVNVAADLFMLPIMLIAVVWLARYLRTSSRGALIGAGVALAVAALVRHAGVGFILGAVAAILLIGPDRAGTRVRDAGLALVLGGLPLFAWLVNNARVSSATGRHLVFHRPHVSELRVGLRTAGYWVLPVGTPARLSEFMGVALLGLVAVLLVIVRRSDPLPVVLLSMALGYLAFVLLTKTFLDVATPIDDRILTPVHVLLLVACAYLISHWIMVRSPLYHQSIAVGVAVAISVLAVGRGGLWLDHFGPDQLEYASPAALHSGLMADVRALPVSEPIFTDAGDLLWVRTGRGAFPLPEWRDPTSLVRNSHLDLQLADMAAVMRARHGVIVWANVHRSYVEPLSDLEHRLSLRVLDREPDGTIFELA